MKCTPCLPGYAVAALVMLVVPLASVPVLACDSLVSVTRVDAGGMETHRVDYDRAALEKLDRQAITTAMPWIEGMSTFEGPTFASIAGSMAEGVETVTVHALDGYESEMPVSELIEYEAVIADSRDGSRLSVRERGPLWLVLPFSDNPEIDTPAYHSRTVWQLCGLELH